MLNQTEIDALLEMAKHAADENRYTFPSAGEKLMIPLTSSDRRETFYLHIYRGRISSMKVTYLNRARTIIPLVRVDIGGPPHANPDGEILEGPHIHVYTEAYGDKWAYPLSAYEFRDHHDKFQVLEDFMRFCRIITKPVITSDFFS